MRYLLILGCLALSGCSTGDRGVSVSHRAREIHLTPERPADEQLGITLLRVESNGAAVISVKRTNEELVATPGQPFLGRHVDANGYRVRTFGESGLVLRNSDSQMQTAVLGNRWAE